MRGRRVLAPAVVCRGRAARLAPRGAAWPASAGRRTRRARAFERGEGQAHPALYLRSLAASRRDTARMPLYCPYPARPPPALGS